MTVRVIVERDGHVAHVRLNRPDKRNGLDLQMFEAILEAGRALLDDRSARAVVLSGEGKAFCAGLDFRAFMGEPEMGRRLLERGDGLANLAQRVAWIWQEIPVPVICAVHGAAIGGGLQIALGADVRYVHPEAQLSVMEIRYGLIPDMSITQTLPRLVGIDVAKELTWSGRIVTGEEAVELGLCTRLSPDPRAAALETARQIATRSPHAIRAAKKLWNEAPSLSARDALRLETELQLPLLGSPNQLEAVTAQMEKREASFRDPD
jgi:enoyl-CoA hydratase/carnithine racemase